MFLLVILSAVAGGTLWVTLFEPREPLSARLAAGAAVGIAWQSLVGFVLASWLGLTPFAILATCVMSAGAPYLAVAYRRPLRGRATRKLREANVAAGAVAPPDGGRRWVPPVYFVVLGIFFCLFFARAAYWDEGRLMTGEDNNYGDLGVHLGIITGFVQGENYPPEHTEMAGTRLTYPFLVDFGAAVLVAGGLEVTSALLLQNLVLALALAGTLYRWVLVLTHERLPALLAPVLVLLNGGLGFVMMWPERDETGRSLWSLLVAPLHSYTILYEWGDVLRWGNALTTLLITQRAFLLGLPLALTVCTLWWQALDEPKTRARRLLAAGFIAGLLPLSHAHSFIVLMAVGACLAVVFWRQWRDWALFFAAATMVAVPQIVWSTRGAGAAAGKFVGWHYGWAMPPGGAFSLPSFWAINLGLTWLGLVAMVWPRRLLTTRHRLFLAPFLLCLVVPNLVRLAPWEWDNIKVLLYGYLALIPPLALLLARLLTSRVPGRILGVAILVGLVLSGGIDVWRVVSRQRDVVHFDAATVAQAALIETMTPPRARILTSQSVSRPTLLTGRRSVIGAEFHIWTHGMDAATAAQHVKAMYAGGSEADRLLKQYEVDYVLVGPVERAELAPNDAYFQRFDKVGEAGGAALYRVSDARP
jgi:hypothetical protein